MPAACSPVPSLEIESFSRSPPSSVVDSDPSTSTDYSPPSSTNGSVSNGGRSSPLGTVCVLCSDTYFEPRVLSCFHVFCLGCLERHFDGQEIIKCPHPQCHATTPGPPSDLIPDYALQRLLETAIAQPEFCTACKSKDGAAVAKCLDCTKLLCPNCYHAHTSMHCFAGHRVFTLADLAHIDKRPVTCVRHKREPLKYFCTQCAVPICKDCTLVEHPKSGHDYELITEAAPRNLAQISNAMVDGRNRALQLRTSIKDIENSSGCIQNKYINAKSEIRQAYKHYQEMLEKRKLEALCELDASYNDKQAYLQIFAEEAQECIDRILSTCRFIDKMQKYANSTELLMFRKNIESKWNDVMSRNFDIGMNNATDLEFVSNHDAIKVSVWNTFGYVRSASDIQHTKLAPIARPSSNNNNNNNHTINSMNSINNALNGLHSVTNVSSHSNNLPNGIIPNGNVSHALSHTQTNGFTTLNSVVSNGLTGNFTNGVTNGIANALNGTISTSMNGNLNGFLERPFTPNQLSFITKRLNASYQPNNSALTDLNLNGINVYEKWSSGEGGVYNQDVVNGFNQPDPILHDLSSKLLSCSLFPPRSQIKRQKMIYHCKFGEFGVLEGQFTEPSGVAVNAQNDIIVADTNNHRIQIFDKEGRFKFQFGECGKRDGQLLYPNRVAVVRTSGDIIVTERSPTHQIQIYNQYGQFVRKFGANTLCYPRGVTVDNKGRIIVVECKVMRVIIFDQSGLVLHQFNCPNYLEFPNGVVVNDKQEIFISDNRAHCVKVFNYEGHYLRQIGGEGITNYPIGVGINTQGEILIADNHNNFNLTLFTQEGQLVSAYESKVKHAQCFDVALMDDGSVVLASKDYRLYVYRYIQVPPPHI